MSPYFIIYIMNHIYMDNKKYDAILYVDPSTISEAIVDRRMHSRKIPDTTRGFDMYYNADDPKMYNTFTFGNAVRQYLNGLGNGFSAHVTDFKKWVVVEIIHHDIITGKTSSKTFLIVFQHDGDGIVLSTHNRYRSISGVDQAVSYIRSACSTLQSDTNNRVV